MVVVVVVGVVIVVVAAAAAAAAVVVVEVMVVLVVVIAVVVVVEEEEEAKEEFNTLILEHRSQLNHPNQLSISSEKCINCSICLLQIITSDGMSKSPVTVDSIIMGPGRTLYFLINSLRRFAYLLLGCLTFQQHAFVS